MGKLQKFQMRNFESWASPGTMKKHHLGALFLQAPQQATELMVQLLAFHTGKTLNTFLSKFPTKEFDTDDEYTWNVIGSARKNIPLVEARTADNVVIDSTYSNSTVGANGEPFYLVFAEDWFGDRETIVGELNEIYPLIVLGTGHNEGTNVVYKVELGGGITTGIPVEEVMPGKRFSAEYAAVEGGLSRKVGAVRFAAPIAMRNEFSHIRLDTKVSGDLLNSKVAFGIPVVVETNGRYKAQVEDMWMHHVQWQFEQQWDEYKNNIIAWGRSNRNMNGEYLNHGKSGEVVRLGAGLFEQMSYGNTSYYNTFSLKMLEDALYELSAAKLGMNERTFIIRTGERGAIQFHKAVLDTVSGWSAFTVNADAVGMVQKTNSPLHQNALAAGFQFVEFRAPNGVVVKLEVDPFYDDPVRNKIMHPNGGPAMSYRYDIFDIGSKDQPNIFKVAVKGQNADFTSYAWGFRDPFTGRMGNPHMSHDEDSASITKFTTTGACVLDPTRTMSLIPAMLAG